MKTDSTGSPYPIYIFNHAVHEARGEQLLFWRLGFYPSFQSREVVRTIDRVLSESGVEAAVLYEVFGMHDLLLRVWSLAGNSLDRFRRSLVDALSPLWLKTLDVFVVNEPVRHWLFPEGAADAQDANTVTEGDVAALRGGQITEARLAELDDKGLVVPFPQTAAEETDAEEIPPIKFAVVLVGQPQLNVGTLEHFQKTVTGVVDRAELLTQRSLYAGFGFAHFLILGAVAPENFYAIDEQLITGLNEEHIQEAFESRTYTYLSGVRRYLLFREGLTQNENDRPPDPTPGPPSPIPDPWRFKLKEKLGEGGFSPVYWVDDVVARREWAMKVFPPEHAGAAEREVRALQDFSDPRIVQVNSFQLEAESGRAYLLMEYIEGEALDARIASGHEFNDHEALKLVDSVLDALAVIHPDQTRIDAIRDQTEVSEAEYELERELQGQAIVHRDIKPGNVVVLPDGSIKLIDFNISSRPGDPVNTRSGTPAYLAPDATNDVWDVSVDLFAAGVVLYELLCGSAHPYPNREPRGDVEPTDPRTYRPDLPVLLAEFLRKACMPARSERFATAKEMSAALRRAAGLDPAAAGN